VPRLRCSLGVVRRFFVGGGREDLETGVLMAAGLHGAVLHAAVYLSSSSSSVFLWFGKGEGSFSAHSIQSGKIEELARRRNFLLIHDLVPCFCMFRAWRDILGVHSSVSTPTMTSACCFVEEMMPFLNFKDGAAEGRPQPWHFLLL
jgi:hypothetical protein